VKQNGVFFLSGITRRLGLLALLGGVMCLAAPAQALAQTAKFFPSGERVKSDDSLEIIRKRCQENTYYDQIFNSGRPNDPNMMLGIATRESACNPMAKNPLSSAAGIWQVLAKTHWQYWQSVINDQARIEAANSRFSGLGGFLYSSNPADRMRGLLHGDPKLSTDAGYKVFNEQMGWWGGTPEAGICGFAGRGKIFKATGDCDALMPVKYYTAYYSGNPWTIAPVVKIEDQNIGKAHLIDDSGKVVGMILECEDRTGKIAASLAKAAKQYGVSRSDVAQQTFANTVGEIHKAGGIMPTGDIREKFCLDDMSLSFDASRALLSGARLFSSMISNILNNILNQACEFVRSTIMTAIDNMLNVICIPVPDFHMSLDLPTLQRKGCTGGMSIGNTLVSLQTMQSPAMASYHLQRVMAAGLDKIASPRINAIAIRSPRMGVGLMGPAFDVLAIPTNKP